MGSEEFKTVARGKTVQEAFNSARESALAEYGHQQGYSGTIYNKHSFVIILKDVTAPDVARAKIEEILDGDDDVRNEVNDKWGPAGAIRLADDKDGLQRWVFFGMSAS